jgi:hypothetical protein
VLRLLGDQSNTSLVALSWDNSNGLSTISARSCMLVIAAVPKRTLSLTNPAYYI